ncbi:MAG: helix-turn-helix transcriptional regulator [Thermomicrobiales bacterium]
MAAARTSTTTDSRTAGIAPAAPALASLTRREQEVLALLRVRMTNQEIAEHLGIGVRTAESHVAAVLDKLGLTNRRALGPRPSPGRGSGLHSLQTG